MGAVWSYPDHAAVDFASLPPAASNNGRVMRCNPLVAGQGYFYMVSDGTYWRPYGGEQKLYVLDAPINMAVNNTPQLLLQIPFPPGSFPDGRTYIKTVLGADKLAITPPATSDTLNIFQRFGTLGTTGDPMLFGSTLAVTNIGAGYTNEANRTSATTMQKHGKGNTYDTAALSGLTTVARGAAITVGNLDTVTNYLSVWGVMTTGTNEYGVLHSYTVEIMG